MDKHSVETFKALLLELPDALLLDLSVRLWGDELVLLFQKDDKKIELVFSLCDYVEYSTDASIEYKSKKNGRLVSESRFDSGKVYNRNDLKRIPYYYHDISYRKVDNKKCFTLDLSMMKIQVVCKDLYIDGRMVYFSN